METGDLRDVVSGPAVLFRESHPRIAFTVDVPAEPVTTELDRRLLAQAVTNLTKNATEAIDALATSPERPAGWQGQIEIRLTSDGVTATVDVIDNGIGLPKQNRAKLLEPYVTTRAKGTGLGLAIVQKIVEQHRGTLTLDDAPPGPGRTRGARVRVVLPLTPDDADGADPSAAPTDGAGAGPAAVAAAAAAPARAPAAHPALSGASAAPADGQGRAMPRSDVRSRGARP
jgi:two-component system nitrogen regulation sensor histidine kinase NtrY